MIRKTLLAIALATTSHFASAALTWVQVASGTATNNAYGYSSGSSNGYFMPGPGTITFTYLGSMATNVNRFVDNLNEGNPGTPSGGTMLTTQNAVGTTISYTFTGPVENNIGYPYFQFTNTNTGAVAANLGSVFTLGAGFLVWAGNQGQFSNYQYVMGFNDGNSDKDYNDMMIGVNFTAAPPVPEASTSMMLLAGLSLVGVLMRRRTARGDGLVG